MFDDIRQAQPSGELVPNVASVSSLNAYRGEEELDYLYLPFINLTCLEERFVMETNASLSYEMFTREFFANNGSITSTVPLCIRDDVFCG